MIVGGNINHLTRIMTTAIALETSKGNYPSIVSRDSTAHHCSSRQCDRDVYKDFCSGERLCLIHH